MNVCNTDVSKELDRRFLVVREGLSKPKVKGRASGLLVLGLPIVFAVLIIIL